MPDHFKSPRLRVARAKKHFADFKSEITRFRDEKNWTTVVQPHSNGLFKEHKIKFIGPPDSLDQLGLIAADAIHNLRSALDQAANASARAGGLPSAKIERTGFPFGTTQNDVNNAIKRGVAKYVPPGIVSFMCSLQPNATGNPLLWAVNKMRNIDTHAWLTPTAAYSNHGTLTIVDGQDTDLRFITGVSAWVAEDDEIIFARSRTDRPDPEYDVDIVIQVAFGKVPVPPLAGQEVVRVLDEMTRNVQWIVETIEFETRRLFPSAFS